MTDIRALTTILPLLYECDAEWCVFSSAARMIDGEDVTPNDIDIMMSENGARRAEEALACYRIREAQPESGKWRSRRGLYRIEDTYIDISGGLERLADGKWEPAKASTVKIKDGIRYTTDF